MFEPLSLLHGGTAARKGSRNVSRLTKSENVLNAGKQPGISGHPSKVLSSPYLPIP